MINTTGAHRCAGYPQGVECMIDVPLDTIFCRTCRERRQREFAEGIRDMPLDHVGIVLDNFDFEGVHVLCKCGGVPDTAQHKMSLLHRKWEWMQTFGADAERARIGERAQPREAG
jgi:hypothetical protein